MKEKIRKGEGANEKGRRKIRTGEGENEKEEKGKMLKI